ncbi:MAG: hypothetical protein ABFS38_04305 [Bacteroidota bacterium]
MPNRLSQFWLELKRRKVVRVITVYAATAFVILELTDIVAPSLGLPDWTLNFIIILLCAGFIIAAIISWIYDIHPEGGIVKTELASEVETVDKPETSNRWKIASYISFIVIIALIILNIIPRAGRLSNQTILDRSIAVLPFRNLSIDSTQAYFCDAVREEILNHLNKVEAFSVRSRTSTDQYKNTEKSIATIGEELNVNYLIEGSIGFEANEIKIWIQLINAKSDEHIWSDDFIRERSHIFSLQSDIAKSIAAELKVIMSPEEIEKIEKTPTEDTDAYQAYMRGRYYVNQPHFIRDNRNRAIQNFQRAVEIDTGFALAYGELATAHALFRYLRWDLSESRLEKADLAAAKALEFGPDIPEVHLALGYYYRYAYRDLKKQEEHWEIAERGLPNNIEIMKAKAYGYESQGLWEEYIKILEKASNLDPNDAEIYSDLGLGLWFSRRYSDAEDALNRAITLNPNEVWPYFSKASNIMAWKGPNKHSRDVLKHVGIENEWYLWGWYFQEVGEGNFKEALALLSDTAIIEGVNNKMWAIPKTLLSAFIYQYLDENELARRNFKTAVSFLEKKVREIPNDPRYHNSLGLAYAGNGQKELAIKEITRAIELLPLSKDAVYGIPAVLDLAIVYTMVGEFDLAMEQLDYLLSFPNFVSVVWIEWDIRFAPLKTHPGYKELAKKYPVVQ